MTPQKIEITTEVTKATPPMAVVAAGAVWGYSLQDWVLIATLIYIVLQAFFLLRKWYVNEKRDWGNDDE